MEERYLEIRFCYLMQKLIKRFNNSIHVLDFIEAVSLLANVDDMVIKNYLTQVRYGRGVIVTYLDEVIYVATQLGKSYRDIAKLTGCSPTSVTNKMKDRDRYDMIYRGTTKKTNDQDFYELKRFMELLDVLKEV
jgi:CRP-like cAMP-binding protein